MISSNKCEERYLICVHLRSLLLSGIGRRLLVLDRLVVLVTLAHEDVDELLHGLLVREIGNVLASTDSGELHDGQPGRDATVTLVLPSLGDLARQDVPAEVGLGTERSSQPDHGGRTSVHGVDHGLGASEPSSGAEDGGLQHRPDLFGKLDEEGFSLLGALLLVLESHALV
jgi:hypothetical protein